MRNDMFGRLLRAGIGSIATCEGKTAPIIEDELGQQIGVSAASIQRYKTGYLPPEPRTVQILAEAAVRRGLLNREWLQRFLHAARYPAPDALIEQLRPSGFPHPRPARVYQNLPAPTYSQFVMRAQAFAEVLDGLQQRSALVLIASLGGMGKTSLAREVAARCLHANGDRPLFDAAVWVSDKDRPGTTTLSIVLDEIARTLDYPGFTQFAHDEKRREVEQLLRRQKVLLVVDNFETIGDGALLAWLLRLPEPSKAIVTSREYSRAFRNSTIVVDLRGMSEAEAQEFIGQRLRFLKIEKLVNEPAALDPLIVATGGNPKAIEMALGLIKHERRPLQQAVDDLYAARGELFDDLFTRAWALLDEAARRVLVSATLFPDSASSEALAATADAQGFAFDRAVERLMDLALLDVQQADLNSPPRHMLHPLVRAFAGVRLAEQSRFEEGARERWIRWYVELVSKVGYCWNDLDKLKLLDPEYEAVHTVIKWTYQHGQLSETIKLAKGVGYYYYVRGEWNRNLSIDLIKLESARRQRDIAEEILALSYLVQTFSKQGRCYEADNYILKLSAQDKSTHLPMNIRFEIYYAIALYYTETGQKDIASQAIRESLDIAKQFPVDYVNNCYYRLASHFYQQGLLEEAQELFQRGLHVAGSHGYKRALAFQQLTLAAIDLGQGNFEDTEQRLTKVSETAYEYQERVLIARTQNLYARLHTLRGDLPAARASLAEAIDLFERLGMRRELAEARAELAQLDQ